MSWTTKGTLLGAFLLFDHFVNQNVQIDEGSAVTAKPHGIERFLRS